MVFLVCEQLQKMNVTMRIIINTTCVVSFMTLLFVRCSVLLVVPLPMMSRSSFGALCSDCSFRDVAPYCVSRHMFC